ncbi:hypothetical protein DITRI_Ditri09bG0013500 [Diplodiscus trichospermus]
MHDVAMMGLPDKAPLLNSPGEQMTVVDSCVTVKSVTGSCMDEGDGRTVRTVTAHNLQYGVGFAWRLDVKAALNLARLQKSKFCRCHACTVDKETMKEFWKISNSKTFCS